MNKFESTCDRFSSWAPIFLRVGLAVVFLIFGSQKLAAPLQTTSEIQLLLGMGFDGASLINYFVGLLELIVGAGLLIGFKTRVLAGVATLMITGIFVSIIRAYGMGVGSDIYRDVGLIGASMALMLLGCGSFGVDGYLARRRENKERTK